MATRAASRQTPLVWGAGPNGAIPCRDGACLYLGDRHIVPETPDHVHHQALRHGPQDPVRPGGLRPDLGKPLRRPREARRPGRAGRGVRRRPGGAGPGAWSAPARPGSESLDAMLAGTDADVVILATPSGLHADQAMQVAAAGRHVMTEKPMATRWQDGKRMVHACDQAGRAPLRGEAEPPQRHAAAAEAGGREAALRPDLHGEHQRLLDPAAVVLRQRAPGAAPGSSTAARS